MPPYATSSVGFSLPEESKFNTTVYELRVADPNAGDVVTVTLLNTTGNAGLNGVSPIFALRNNSLVLYTAVPAKQLDYDAGLRTITVCFTLQDARGSVLFPGPYLVPVNITATILSECPHPTCSNPGP